MTLLWFRIDSVVVTLIGAPVGILCPPVRRKTLGNAAKHGIALGSVMSRPIRSGPGGSATVPSSGSSPSSVIGSELDVAMLRSVGLVLDAATVMQYPLMSRILMVTGQIKSVLSPRVPAKTASVPETVGNGLERTAKVGLAPGMSRKKAVRVADVCNSCHIWIGFGERSFDAFGLFWVSYVSSSKAVELSCASGLVGRSRRVGSVSG